MVSGNELTTQIRTRATFWFAVVVFARVYTTVLCEFIGNIPGLDFICFTWIHGIASYLWIEIIFYGPVIWFALYQVNNDVFGDVPSEPEALRRHRRAKLMGTMAIAFVLYGVGVHVTDAIEVFSREHEGITDGSVYDLVYFLDEGLSHYFQFFPFFFVMGWFLIYDRPGRTAYPYLAIFFGVAHGVERTVGIIEGEKWFLGPAAFAWMAFAAWLRWRRVGPDAATEFFFKHAVAFCLTVPVTLVVYYTRFDSFPPPSGLSQARLAEVWIGSVLVTVVCTAAVVVFDRWWSRRRAGLAT